MNLEIVFRTAACEAKSVSIRNAGSFPRTIRTAPIKRPCTLVNAAGIQRFSPSDLTSFVIRPLRNITASDPLTRIRPRDDRSINPAPSSRTARYSEFKSVFIRVILGTLWPPSYNPATAPPRADVTPTPADLGDRSARARDRSTSVSEPQTPSNSTRDIECASTLRAQLNPTSRSRADQSPRLFVAGSRNNSPTPSATVYDLRPIPRVEISFRVKLIEFRKRSKFAPD